MSLGQGIISKLLTHLLDYPDWGHY